MKNNSLQKSRNNCSDTDSKSSSSQSINSQKGGDVIETLFGKNAGKYVTKLILDAFNNNLLDPAVFDLYHALNDSVDVKFGAKDSNGKTILHWVVEYSSKYPQIKSLIPKILENDNAVNNINAQDNKGNTVTHYALRCNMQDVVNLFARKGADLSIRNSDGLAITLQKEYVKPPNVFKKNVPFEAATVIEVPSNEIDMIRQKIGNLVNSIVQRTDTDDSDIDFDNTVSMSVAVDNQKSNSAAKPTESLLNSKDKEVLDEIMRNVNKKIGAETEATDEPTETGSYEVVDKLVKEFNNKDDNVLDNIMKNYNEDEKIKMLGGSNIIKGSRKMNTYSELSMGGGDEDSSSSTSSSCSSDDEECSTSSSNDDSSSSSDDYIGGSNALDYLGDLTKGEIDELVGYAKLSKISRAQNESDDKHEAAVSKIMEILKIDRLAARAYKAVLYKQIRDENPNLNSLDRATELLKRASDAKILNSISKSDVENLKEIIAKKDEERASSDNKSDKGSNSDKKKKEPAGKKKEPSEKKKPAAKKAKKEKELSRGKPKRKSTQKPKRKSSKQSRASPYSDN